MPASDTSGKTGCWVLAILLMGLGAARGTQPPKPGSFNGSAEFIRRPAGNGQNSSSQPSTGHKSTHEIEVSGNRQWTDTGIDLHRGDHLVVAASGTIVYGANSTGPEGLARSWRDLLLIYPVNSLGRGALIGRIGNDTAAEPFVVGTRREFDAGAAGRLFLGINQGSNDAAEGSFKVSISIAPGSAAAIAPLPGASISPDILAKIPPRVADPDGRPGDMVNFLIVGSQDALEAAFEAAGWVKVDRTTTEGLLHGLLASISKESYVQMPMSTLMLFGRPQDYGYAHADPLTVVATRHHLRIWKTPIRVDGQPLWAGAGTHDMGFERDQRNGGITHHIDPAIDSEREFIEQSLGTTGRITKMGYVTPANPVGEAKTATGESFHSDGRLLVMMLAASSRQDRSAAFADTFCGVLRQENPDTGTWGDCSQYLEATASSDSAPLPPISTSYRVLVLPGIFNPCVSSTAAFQKGQDHLRQAHGLTVEYLTLPNASSESDGNVVTDYLESHMRQDSRKYIVVAYSKGAPDFQVGIAQHPEAAAAVAAFVTVAGAVGGSPIADAMPAIAKRYIDMLHLGSCQGDLTEAFKSLRADIRHSFLLSHPNPPVPSYSLVAVSDKGDTSKMLQQSWSLLGIYGPQEDSQLLRDDAIVPGAAYLGAARADHLAVALGFDDPANSEMSLLMDHNRYPRAALLEAIVRFTEQDLAKSR